MNKRHGTLIAGLLLMATTLAAADIKPCPVGPRNLPTVAPCKKVPPPAPQCKGPLPCKGPRK
jgi:hypothetical protein